MFLVLAPVCKAQIEVVFPNLDGIGEEGYEYQLLKLALSKTGKPYSPRLYGASVTQERAFVLLEQGKLSVVPSGINQTREAQANTVYIPIDRGLNGWRMFVIHKDSLKDFSEITTLEELKDKLAGQGIGWVDSGILQFAGLEVMNTATMKKLFDMLHGKRYDFLPLGVNEIHGFLNTYAESCPDLRVEETLVLTYPFGRFYYVKQGNETLHNDIQTGLERAYADGSFQELFYSHPFISNGLNKARLPGRTIIQIDNPYTSAAFQQIDPKWWYSIENIR